MTEFYTPAQRGLEAWDRLSLAEKSKLSELEIDLGELTKIVQPEFWGKGIEQIRTFLEKNPVTEVRVYSAREILSESPQEELFEQYGGRRIWFTDQYHFLLGPHDATRFGLRFIENDARIRERIRGEGQFLGIYHELWMSLFLRGLTSGKVPAFNVGGKMHECNLEGEAEDGTPYRIKDVEVFPRADYVKEIERYEPDFHIFVEKMIASKRGRN
ncbi:hypothetical protein HZC30_02755 [Candidatus Woesearchaeota archaeon]|nr:hypothetical protein [Candidatus Woesearchaeota archaeon]